MSDGRGDEFLPGYESKLELNSVDFKYKRSFVIGNPKSEQQWNADRVVRKGLRMGVEGG
jgi:hypothetical protein